MNNLLTKSDDLDKRAQSENHLLHRNNTLHPQNWQEILEIHMLSDKLKLPGSVNEYNTKIRAGGHEINREGEANLHPGR